MRRNEMNTEWRRIAAALYRKPIDSKIFGSVEFDVTDLEKYISEKRKEGIKITLTHIFALALARGLKEAVPELNCFVRRGNIIPRKSIDAMVSVLVDDTEMSSVRISDADQLTLEGIAHVLGDGIKATRSGSEDRTMKMKGVIAKIPWPFRSWIFNLIKFITIKWGLTIPAIGLGSNNFGSFVLSNIGTIGLDMGYPALFPISDVAFVVIMGGVYKKPVVVNDEIVIRRIITLSTALDHRVVDAMHGGKLFKYVKNLLRDPSVLERPPMWLTDPEQARQS
ncbi:MAG: 2-oxo acid dehydrogenase subunit E2 [Bacteroidota bacterium]